MDRQAQRALVPAAKSGTSLIGIGRSTAVSTRYAGTLALGAIAIGTLATGALALGRLARGHALLRYEQPRHIQRSMVPTTKFVFAWVRVIWMDRR